MIDFSQISAPIEQELAQFKTFFNESLNSQNPVLNQVLTHVKQHPGKMMRPVLTLLAAKLCGEVTPASYHAALALELLHTASLLHDDVVDEADQRRGEPSVNALTTNKIAVLSGDYLLSLSLVHAAKTLKTEIVNVVGRLGKQLADGEIMQLDTTTDWDTREERYFEVIRKKTASLFIACGEAGSLSANATIEQREALCAFGDYLGICFQIKDDIFDYYESTEVGKPTGNDMREGKLTLPAIYYVLNEKSGEGAALARKITTGHASAEEVQLMIEQTKANGGIGYAIETMNQYKEKAAQQLNIFEDGAIKQALLDYLTLVIERTK